MTEPVCNAVNLHKRYPGSGGGVAAVVDASLAVAAGEHLVIHGPSGSGKSTLLLMLGGLLRPDSGSVTVDGFLLPGSDARAAARFRAAAIGFVFQQFHLLPYLNARQNVCAPQLAGAPVSDDRAAELLQRLQLGDRMHHKPAALSVGEQQRVALARAVVNQPKLLLADEPTANLDRDSAELVLAYFADFAKSGGAVISVTHDAATMERADRRLRMRDGHLHSP